jgi:hypothetical protein
MDEYVYVHNESLGLMGHAPGERAEKITEAIATATSLRSPSLGCDEKREGDRARGSGLPPVLPPGRALEPALEPGRPRSARGPRAPVERPRDPPQSGQAIWSIGRPPLLQRADRPLAAPFRARLPDRSKDANDLEPYWIFDTKGGYKIERQISLLPLSREVGQLAWLKKTLVAYRSVIGQPRQQELVEFMLGRMTEEELEALTRRCSIDLSPRREPG